MLVHTVQQFRCDFRRVQRDINDIQTLILQTWLGAISGRKWYTTARKLNELGYDLVEKFKERLYSDYSFQQLRYALYTYVNGQGELEDVAARFDVEAKDLQYLNKLIKNTSFSPPTVSASFGAADLLSQDEVFMLIDRSSSYFRNLIGSPKFYYLSQAYASADSLENQLFFKAWVVALRNLELNPAKLENTIKCSVKRCLIDIARRHTASQRNKHMLVSSHTIKHGPLALTKEGCHLRIDALDGDRWEIDADGTVIIVDDGHIDGVLLGTESTVEITTVWAVDAESVYFRGEKVGRWSSAETRRDFDLREFSLSGNTDDFVEDHNIYLVDSRAEMSLHDLEAQMSGAAVIDPESENMLPEILATAHDLYNRDLYRDAIPLFKKALTINRNKELITLLGDCYYEIRAYYWAWRYYKQVNRDSTVRLILTELNRYDFGNGILPGQRIVYNVKGKINYGRVDHVHKAHVYILNQNTQVIEKIGKPQIYAFTRNDEIIQEDYAASSDLNRLVCARIGNEPQVVARTLNASPDGYLMLCISHYPGQQRVVKFADVSPCCTRRLSRLRSPSSPF